MKKILLITIMILIIILSGITIVKGFQIGEFTVLGITDIKNKNDELDEKIKQATKIASTDYQKKIDTLNDTIKKLESEKTNYEDMVDVSTDSEVQAANQTYENMIEFLLVRIENHAKTEGVTIKMDVTRSSSGAENVYNLNFTATGIYVGIEEFITDVEDDSKLGFRIEDFQMISAATEENSNIVQATFTCKDIKIEGISSNTVTNVTSNTEDENTTSNTTKDNTVQ